ncbi:MAG: RNA methyltransferase [Burkholderiaceae bacterium]
MSLRVISSRDNPQYKELRLLATSSQARRRSCRTLLDGVHLCEAYLQRVGMPRLCIIGESARGHPEAGALLASCEAGNADCLVLPDTLFAALSQVEHGVDLLFTIDTPQPSRPPGLNQSAVLLDSLQDPGNLGSILRSAAAAGIRSAFCSVGTAVVWAPKVLRAGMGAHFLLTIAENVDLAALIDGGTVPVVATSSHAASTLYTLDLRQPVAWLFGHEGQGVSRPLLSLATHCVAIPQPGAIESLNVAACAAVCFFEQVRQQVNACVT